MTVDELEAKYSNRIRRAGSLFLLPASAAKSLLIDCSGVEVRFIGIEAFRFTAEGAVQPSMEFSNIRFGTTEEVSGKVVVTEFKRALRSGWRESDAIDQTLELINRGVAAGFDWYEVSLEEPSTNELLFFRSAGA